MTLYSEEQKNTLLTLCPGIMTSLSSNNLSDGYHDSVKTIVLCSQLLTIREAPEPQQIDWHNIGTARSGAGWLGVLLMTLFVIGQDILVIYLIDQFYSDDSTHLLTGICLVTAILLYLLCQIVYQRLVTKSVLS